MVDDRVRPTISRLSRGVIPLGVLCLGLSAAAAFGFSTRPKARLEHRWVYVSRSLQTERHVDEIRDIARRASRHGYNGMVLSSSFDGIALRSESYARRLKRVRGICVDYGLALIPSVCSAGHGGGVLEHDKHLAAAVPVSGALYRVRNGEASIVAEGGERVENGGFERHHRHRALGYDLQDGPGRVTFIDTGTHAGGGASLRLENFGKSRRGLARVAQDVGVEPFRTYRLTCWVRTEGLDPAGAFQLQVRGGGGRVLMSWIPRLSAAQGWTRVTTGFNTLDNDRVRIYAGVWRGRGGRVWVDDLEVTEAGAVNVLRRPGTPVTVRGERSGLPYREGEDYAWIEDDSMDYRFDHPDPPVRILPGGRIGEGELLTLDYYQALALNEHQVAVCMSEPGVYEVWRDAVRRIDELLAPESYFLSMDEVRQGGWCRACLDRGLSAAETLGRCITRQVEIVRGVNPDADVVIWSDMLDPNHNATDRYYLYNGDLTGSWRYVPADLIIACWYFDKREASLEHFDRLGFRTLAAAFYDASSLEDVEEWLKALEETPRACGIMYTTWKNRYEFLEPFGDLLSGVR